MTREQKLEAFHEAYLRQEGFQYNEGSCESQDVKATLKALEPEVDVLDHLPEFARKGCVGAGPNTEWQRGDVTGSCDNDVLRYMRQLEKRMDTMTELMDSAINSLSADVNHLRLAAKGEVPDGRG